MANMLTAVLGSTGGWKRQAAALLGVAFVSASLVTAADKPKLTSSKPQSIQVTARPLAGFDKTKPEQVQFGRLTWRGGIELTSPSKHFGGWSGLRIDAKGTSVLAVSDAGAWLRATLRYDKGRLAGVTGAKLGALKAVSGKPLSRRRDRDAEAVAVQSGSIHAGTALIAFEQNDRVGIFPLNKHGIGKPKRYLKLPNAIRKNRRVNGMEALTVLRGGKHNGAMVTFLEAQLTKERYHRGWLLVGGKAHQLWLKDKGGFSITDLASLPDGGVVVLERRFRWSEGVKLRLRYLPQSSIKPGAKLHGEVLLEADMSKHIDNMEGVAVHQTRTGEKILTLISDDNFNPLFQRTLILQFAWQPKVPTKSKSVERRQ